MSKKTRNKIVLCVLVCFLFGGCEQREIEKAKPIKHKFWEGDIIKHKVLGFEAQVISNGSKHWEYKEGWRGKCVVIIYPPISSKTVEFIKGNDGGYRRSVEDTQIQKVTIRECEFEKVQRSPNEQRHR